MAARPSKSQPIPPDIRQAIRDSGESLRVLARRFGVNPKTVAKWKQRESLADLPRGPKFGQNRKLSDEEQGIIVRFREHTLLPLDDCLYALQARIPHLTRSSLHRCLQRHGVSRLPADMASDGANGPSAPALGDVQIELSCVRAHDGSHYLFNALEQASKFVFVDMCASGDETSAAAFLTEVAQRSPFIIRRVLTSDAEPFVAAGRETGFGRACRSLGIEHCLIPDADPWTRHSGVRIGRMVQDSVTFTSKHYLAGLLEDFVHAYNFRRKLKTLRGRTPHAFLCSAWQDRPEQFRRDPHHDLAGLEIAHG